MKKKFIATKEEIGYIKEVISDILSLWNHEIISASSENGAETSMSKETFYEQLENSLK